MDLIKTIKNTMLTVKDVEVEMTSNIIRFRNTQIYSIKISSI